MENGAVGFCRCRSYDFVHSIRFRCAKTKDEQIDATLYELLEP